MDRDKQQLRGSSLTEFLISKTGFKWDAVPVENIKTDDLDRESFDIFRREAIRSGRMSREDLDMTNGDLLDNLGLIVDGKLKRAAVMLFYRKPERLITGCYVKIGKFGNGADLQYQDELHGSLIIIADRVVELIYLKYLKAAITYDKEIRIETYPFPRDGVREAIYNSLIHSNWADSIPIQIRIDDDAMYISNCCILPSNWTTATLIERHKSRPYNPDIANAFFRAGYVETWGRIDYMFTKTISVRELQQSFVTVWSKQSKEIKSVPMHRLRQDHFSCIGDIESSKSKK